MNNSTHCTKCDSTQLSVQKRGFSGQKAIKGFIIMTVLLAIVWAFMIYTQNENNRLNASVDKETHINEIEHDLNGTPIPKQTSYADNKVLWISTVILLGVSLLNGSIDSEQYETVCLICGDVKAVERQSNNIVSNA